jgi:hypothetical protein
MRRATLAPALAAALLAGCTGSRLGAPQPTFTGLRAVRASGIPALAVGGFAPGPDLPRGRDGAIIIRAAALRPPQGSSFSAYLGETLRSALASAGRLDPAAAIIVSGLLTENSVDSGFGRGGGKLAATFIVTRDGREVWRKSFRAERDWDSSVLGAVAYINADQNYGALYQMLIEQLLADPDFRQAVRPAA